MGALVAREIVKTLIGVLRQHQTGEQTRRLFCFRNFLIDRTCVLLEAFDLPDRLEIHLAIGRVQIWELTRQAFAKKVTRNLARLIDFRQCKPGQWQSGWRTCDRNFCLDIVPASQQFTPEFFIGARALHLIEHELVIIFDSLNNLSEFAHFFLRFCW